MARGEKLSDFGEAELKLLVQHFKKSLSNQVPYLIEVPSASFANEMLLDEWFRFKLLEKD